MDEQEQTPTADKVIKVPIDMDGKQFIVIHNFKGDSQGLMEKIDQWLNSSNAPVFLMIASEDTKIEIVKTRRHKHG